MSDKLFFHTPVGRFVNGSLTELRDKDNNNRPIDPDKQRFEFGLAVRKDDPNLPAMFQQLRDYAKGGYASNPAVQQRIDAWFQTMSGFSMKISDGDKPAMSTGKVNENTAGCFVLWFSTALPILTANAQNQQIDAASIQRGFYVDVAASAAVNGLVDHNAGIYLNPGCVRLIAEGDVIASTMSIDTVLQNAPAAPSQLPPGARPVGSTPQAPASSGVPGTGMPGMGAPNPTPVAATPPATPAPGVPMPGVQGGTPPTNYAPVPGGPTASPGDTPQTGHPQHHGVMMPGLPGQG